MSERLEVKSSRVPAAVSTQRKLKNTTEHSVRPISTLIIGRPGFYAEGLRRILEHDRLCEVSQVSNTSSTEYLRLKQPTLVILTEPNQNLDLNNVLLQLRSNTLNVRIVVLLDESCSDQIMAAMSIPAHAFLSATISPTALLNALEVVFGDGGVLSINFTEYLALRYKPCDAKLLKAELTDQRLCLSGRETDILRCLTDGISNKHIARQFGIAESTVKIHVKSILRKINVQNRTQAAIWALANYPHPEPIDMASLHAN